MKLTIEIDDELMARAREVTCTDSDQVAIERSLMHLNTHALAKEYFSKGPHLTYADLKNIYAPNFDPRAPVPSYEPLSG